jgi:crossover junction endodeoxyribonuclease RuvC
MVRTILGLAEVPTPDDAADALAVAICLAHSYRDMNLAAAQTPSLVPGPVE